MTPAPASVIVGSCGAVWSWPMFLLPVGTDAPIYHFPWGTLGLMTISTLVLLAGSVGWLPPPDVLASQYGLVHGEGLHPWQWVTSNFLHAGWTHLIGNLMFLWVFGLIVEGKIGWARLVTLFLILGATECLLEQLLLPGPGLSLGASSVIFGLMAIAFVWAPRNDIEMAYGFWLPFVWVYRIGSFGVSVLTMSVLMVVKELLLAVWWRFPIGSELFHLVGAALGFGAGVSMLRGGWVDCEGWDLVSLLRRQSSSGSRPQLPVLLDGRSPELDALTEEEQRSRQTGRKLRALRRVHRLLQQGRPRDAWQEVLQTKRLLDHFLLGPRDLNRLGQALFDVHAWRETVAVYEELIERFPQESDLARLIVADILIHHQGRPAAALRHLAQVDPTRLPGEASRRHAELRRAAEQLVDAGVVELEGRPWESI